MTSPTQARRLIIVRASRDTLVLIAAATTMTFALAYAVSKKPPASAVAPVAVQQKGWTGDLAGVPAEHKALAHDPEMTSASLVVPKASLALPLDPSPRLPPTVKKPCDGPACAGVKTAVPIPPVRSKDQTVAGDAIGASAPASVVAPPVAVVVVKSETKDAPGLGAKLNPLNHIPDVVKQPFGFAGDKLAGWFKRL